MKWLVLLLFAIIGSTAAAQTYPPSGYANVFSYKPASVAQDIGDGNNYMGGTAKWFTGVEYCCSGDPLRAYYTPDYSDPCTGSALAPFSYASPNMKINLVLHPYVQGCAGSNQNGNEAGYWTSGILASTDNTNKYGYNFQYGYVVCNYKVPGPQVGTWPGCYLKDTATHGKDFEIDIVEHYSYYPTAYSITVHDWKDGGIQDYECNTNGDGKDLSANFHGFGVLWTSYSMTFTLDGVALMDCPNSGVFNYTKTLYQQPAYIIMDLGVGQSGGPNLPGNPSSLPTTSSLYINSVSVWQPK